MMKLDELRFALDYSISEDFLNLPGNPPPRLWGQRSLNLISSVTQGERAELAALHK